MEPTQKLSRRSFLSGSALATAASVLAACAPAATPTPAKQATAAQPVTQPTAKPAASGEKVKLQIMWWPVGGDRGLKAMEAALKPFDDANPNITVERVPVAQNYFDKLLTMFAGGTPPDVCAIDNYNITEMADKGVLKELDPIIEKDKSFSLDAFFPAALKEGVWKGKRWALPYIGSTRIMYYNIDIIQKKGLETPDKLWEAGKWTWEAFLEYAQKLTDRSGGPANTIYGCNDDRNWGAGGISPWIWGAKGEILSEDHTKVLFNKPEAVAGVKFVQDLIFKHQVAPKADAMKDVDLVATGRIGMWMSWRGLSMSYRAFTYKWDVVPFPVGPAGKTTLYKGNSMSIARDTKYPDQAWLLCKHITGKEADAIYVGNGGATPRKDNRDVLMKSTPPQNNQYFYDPLNEGWTKMLPFNPKWRQWTTESQKYLDRIFLDGEDVQKVMNECAPAVEKILNEK
mgnify:CR=1 FL=1